jgi:hypothetical protein
MQLTIHLVGEGNHANIQFLELAGGQIAAGIYKNGESHNKSPIMSYLILYYSVLHPASRAGEKKDDFLGAKIARTTRYGGCQGDITTKFCKNRAKNKNYS